MATLRPLFRTFLSRSRLLGSSKQYAKYGGSESQGWPQSFKKGYLKSGSGLDTGDNTANVELGLRNDIRKDAGVTTVIKSQHDQTEEMRQTRELENSKGGQIGDQISRWNNSESRLKDDNSSEEAMPSTWGVRKTTEVTTQEHAVEAGS